MAEEKEKYQITLSERTASYLRQNRGRQVMGLPIWDPKEPTKAPPNPHLDGRSEEYQTGFKKGFEVATEKCVGEYKEKLEQKERQFEQQWSNREEEMVKEVKRFVKGLEQRDAQRESKAIQETQLSLKQIERTRGRPLSIHNVCVSEKEQLVRCFREHQNNDPLACSGLAEKLYACATPQDP